MVLTKLVVVLFLVMFSVCESIGAEEAKRKVGEKCYKRCLGTCNNLGPGKRCREECERKCQIDSSHVDVTRDEDIMMSRSIDAGEVIVEISKKCYKRCLAICDMGPKLGGLCRAECAKGCVYPITANVRCIRKCEAITSPFGRETFAACAAKCY